MPAERFYCEDDLQKGREILLQDSEFRHLAQVMRVQVGEVVELVNGRGALAQGEVTELEKKRVRLQIIESQQAQESKPVMLAQAMPKINRLDFIIEKGTELGMTALWLFPGQRSEKKEASDNQLQRWRAITIAAMKQSGALFLPQIIIKPPLAKWNKQDFANAVFGDFEPGVPALFQAWEPTNQLVLIGPEAGFSEQEVALLRANGVKGVSLHRQILRTDTASLAALAIIEQKMLCSLSSAHPST